MSEPLDYPTLSSLNHLLFCERRCALLRIENVWVENVFTLEGRQRHRVVHAEGDAGRSVDGGRAVRNLDLVSHRLRIVGKGDVVEFGDFPRPVEFKRGRRRRWDNDDVQLCAQALCLEEMFSVAVPAGDVFHLASRRRRTVLFDALLRARTEEAVRRLHDLVASDATPPPVLKPRCKGCSLADVCLPQVGSRPDRTSLYLADLYRADPA